MIEELNMPIEMRRAVIWLFFGIILCVFSYEFIDQPVAFWVFNDGVNKIPLLKKLTYLPVVLVGLALVAYAFLFIRFCLNRYDHLDQLSFLTVNAMASTHLLKSVLKIVFARYWPMTWIRNNPSLIHDGVYGFKWLQMGSNYGAFPSGHSAMMAAGMVALSLGYPKLRWFFVFLWLLVAVGLVGMNYHFVSDVIGGAALGASVTYSIQYVLGLYRSRLSAGDQGDPSSLRSSE
jgi:membrane-associated phospholipid phosphatase